MRKSFHIHVKLSFESAVMRLLFFALLLVSFANPAVAFGQSVEDQIGFTKLEAELGAATPDGNGLKVAIVEAPRSGSYLPDVSSGQFAGKTIVDGSGTNGGANSHATGVSIRYFGNTTGLASGVSDITGYDANDYIFRVLGAGNGADPLPDSFAISNHSYIANGLSDNDSFLILSRFDFLVNRDNTVAVVGANNGATSATPDLIAPSFNAITVGRTNGNHSRTATSGYGTSRTKPDIVAPEGSTSNATPRVASAAGVLLDAAEGTNGAENEAVRAMLFAGATKEEFADWDRTSTRPLDDVFGFGELNIYNSYKIFEGGEFDGQTSNPSSNVGFFGYDFATFDGTRELHYNIEVTETSVVSAVLTWNAVITDSNPFSGFSPSLSLANLDLCLYDSSGSFKGLLLDESVSTDYNHEHIYLDLEPGSYTLAVSGDASVDFGLAWRVVEIPNVASFAVNAVGETQRSAIETLSVVFDREVEIDDNAFSLVQRSTATEETFEDVAINLTEEVIDSQTHVTIQFDSHTRNSNNALEDGNYQLTVTANQVTNNGVPLPETLVVGAVESDGFFSYYGDSDGNRTVNVLDLFQLRGTFGSSDGSSNYEYSLDFDASGTVNVIDLLQFRNRYLSTLPFTFNSNRSLRGTGNSGVAFKGSDSTAKSGAAPRVQRGATSVGPIKSNRNAKIKESDQSIPTLDLSVLFGPSRP